MSRKKLGLLLFMFICFFFCNNRVKANYQARFVSDNKCALKSNATGNCFYSTTKYTALVSGPYWLDTGDMVTVYTDKGQFAAPKNGQGSECKTYYSYVSTVYKNTTYYGFACTSNMRAINSTDGISEDLKKKFQNAGFPSDYWSGLAILQEEHPKWQFIAVKTGLKFNEAVAGEDVGKTSLIQSTSKSTQGFLSTKETNYNWKTDTFVPYDGQTWFAANRETIAYYMDPRNFLSNVSIFQFESLSWDPNIQTLNGVKDILGKAYIGRFADSFMVAAKETSVNPIYLASLSRQEIGSNTNATTAVSGGAFTYTSKEYGTVKYPGGVYNFFNIGATSGSDGQSAIRGLIYANGGESKNGGFGGATSYGRPWNSEEKAIIGGALFVSKGYVSVGQDTSYFKKWDVQLLDRKTQVAGNKNSLYNHQYMQNIQAPTSEAEKSFHSYLDNGLLDSAFVFYIPVYDEMPATTSLPPQGNPNNYLSSITYNDGSKTQSLNGFDGAVTNYSFHVANNVTSVTFQAKAVNSGSNIQIKNLTSLVVGNNTATITVTAGNGSKRNYQITVIRDAATGRVKSADQVVKDAKFNIDGNYLTGLTFTTSVGSIKSAVNNVESRASVVVKQSDKEKTSGNLVTGDTVTINSGNTSKTYTVVLYGDNNGDGKVNALDLLRVQKNILGVTKLNGANLKAADPSKDGKVNALDLLKVQKHILGKSIITQK